jgi:hypothetical protein
MNEHDIESRVERMTDRLDARFMSDHKSKRITLAEYKDGLREIDDWAKEQYAKSNN